MHNAFDQAMAMLQLNQMATTKSKLNATDIKDIPELEFFYYPELKCYIQIEPLRTILPDDRKTSAS